jgi:PKD repeat protein
LSDFTVSAVDWGDGGTSTAGLSISGGAGNFTVTGTHLYAAEGPYSFTITVTDDGGMTATITGTALVAPVPIVATGVAVSGSEFAPLNNVTVATFTHANGMEPAVDFTATIDWGDGTSSSGTVALSATTYTVSGVHTYGDEKSYAVTVRVVDDAVSATVTTTATMLEELLPGGVRGTPDERFISEIYRDFLGRPVDASGMASSSVFLAAGNTPAELVSAIKHSFEFEKDTVDMLYERYLHRAADAGGEIAYVSLMDHGATIERISALLAASPEFFATQGGGTNDGFLAALYLDALGRPIDVTGQSSWNAQLAAGASRLSVAAAILSSQEYRQHVVDLVYGTLLDRIADPGGLDTWTGALAAGATDQQISAGIAASNEYFAKTSA